MTALPGFLKAALGPVRARCRGGEGWTLALRDKRTPALMASSIDDQALVVPGEEIFIQAFEFDCPAGANSDPMLNHEVRVCDGRSLTRYSVPRQSSGWPSDRRWLYQNVFSHRG
jgi:hypothetical protein